MPVYYLCAFKLLLSGWKLIYNMDNSDISVVLN